MKRIIFPLISILLFTVACKLFTHAPPTSNPPTATSTITRAPFQEGTPAPVSTGLPDLIVGQYASVRYFGCPWTEGGEIRGQVKNAGTGRAGVFDVQINGELSSINGLESGIGAYTGVTFNKGPVGAINILADPQNQILESDNNNNSYQIIFTPPPPCYTLTTTANPPPAPSPSPTPIAPFNYTIPANSIWNQPMVVIERGDLVTIRYLSGSWTYSPAAALFDARGNLQNPICGMSKPGSQCEEVLPLAPAGALLAVMPLSDYLVVGDELTFTAGTSGFINFQMNAAADESALKQRSGEITVEITITKL